MSINIDNPNSEIATLTEFMNVVMNIVSCSKSFYIWSGGGEFYFPALEHCMQMKFRIQFHMTLPGK